MRPMAIVQTHYGLMDPNERSCRTCRWWDGNRSWPLTDETREGRCSVSLPPYLLQGVDSVTKATDECRFHDYAPRETSAGPR